MARPPRAPGRAVPPREVMTITDLAEYLQVSKSSLYKLVQSGRVPGQKVGKHWRFHKDTIDAWLKQAPKNENAE
ncbi:MAG: helix-turn-helix domain-containing protein [Phycisphaerales bacterium]|nr:helix-turn-helix domain-containing protein [Phycisphaerales bacterium]